MIDSGKTTGDNSQKRQKKLENKCIEIGDDNRDTKVQEPTVGKKSKSR